VPAKDEVVECLLPYSLKAKKEAEVGIQVLPPPPRLLDVASAVMAHEFLLSGDPDGDGIWDQATRHMLTALPPLLIKLRKWDVLFQRVWGSLPFLAQFVLEHGPDALIGQMDLTRAALQAEDAELLSLEHHPEFAVFPNSWEWVGAAHGAPLPQAGSDVGMDDGAKGEGDREGAEGGRQRVGHKLFALHREFVYMYKEALRRQPIMKLAREANLPGVDALIDAVKGKPSGMLCVMTQAMEKAETLDSPSPETRDFLLHILRKLRHLKELGLVGSLTDSIERAEGDVGSFLADLDLESGTSSSYFDEMLAATLSDSGRTGRACLAAIDSYALDFQANVPEAAPHEVLRIELAASYVPRLVPQIVSSVLQFLKEYPLLRGARVRVIRAEPSFSADSNALRLRQLLYVAVSGLAQVRAACVKLVEDFYSLASGTFPRVARSKFRFAEVDLLNPSVFLSLVFLRRSSPLLATPAADRLLQQRALEWREQLQRVAPSMSDEEIAAEVERLWFAQKLREDLAEALELSRDDLRVVCVAGCQCRAVVELVSRAKGVAHGNLLSRARQLQGQVSKGESVFALGKALAAFEYLRAVDISAGHCPPAIPGQWVHVSVYCGSSGADTLPERRALAVLVLPALQRVLRHHRIHLSTVDLSLNGPLQGTRAVTPLPLRLEAMSACGFQCAGSEARTPFFLGVLAGEGGSGGEPHVVVARNTVPGAVVAGNGAGNTITVRAWAGDTSETAGHARPAGRDRLSMTATLTLEPGEYTGGELAAHLKHVLTHSKWADDKTFQPVALGLGRRNPRGRGLPMEWVCGIDDDGYLYISSVSYTFFRFEFTFQSETLAHFLGLQVDDALHVQSSEVVRQRPEETEGYQPRDQYVDALDDDHFGGGGSEVSRTSGASSMTSVFVSTLRACVPVNPSEDRLQCFRDHDFMMRAPWVQMSDAGLELGKACFLNPLAGENVLLVRDSSWMRDKTMGTVCSSGQLAPSAVHCLGFSESGGLEAEPLEGQLVRMALSLGEEPFNVPQTTYPASFRKYERNTGCYLERFEALLDEIEDIRLRKGLAKKGSSSRFGANLRDQIIGVGTDSTGNAAQVAEGCGLTSDDLYLLKMECYKWWRLVREDYDMYDKAGRCPHGMPVERCAESLCERLYAAAQDTELKQCDERIRAGREAGGLPETSALWHTAPSMAGVGLDVQEFAKAALTHLYAAVIAHAPAAPVPPQGVSALPVRLVNPVDPQQREEAAQRRREHKFDHSVADKLPMGCSCRPLHSHLDVRAAQKSLQHRLSKGFLMLPGGSRNKAFYELERNSTGPCSSLPPLLLLRGPPGSGKTRMMARVSTHSARCSAQRALVRHMTSSKFASHYSSAQQPFQPFETYSPVSMHALSEGELGATDRGEDSAGLVQVCLLPL